MSHTLGTSTERGSSAIRDLLGPGVRLDSTSRTLRETDMPVKVVALVAVKPGQEEAFAAAAMTCVTASRQEPDVRHYELWRETDGERRFVFNEVYEDDAAVDAHMQSEHFEAFGMASWDLAVGRPAVIRTHEVDVVFS